MEDQGREKDRVRERERKSENEKGKVQKQRMNFESELSEEKGTRQRDGESLRSFLFDTFGAVTLIFSVSACVYSLIDSYHFTADLHLVTPKKISITEIIEMKIKDFKHHALKT